MARGHLFVAGLFLMGVLVPLAGPRAAEPPKAPKATSTPRGEIPRIGSDPPPRSDSRWHPPPDSFRTVIATPVGPIVVGYRVELEGKTLAQAREEFLTAFTERCDKNHDGILTVDEVAERYETARGKPSPFPGRYHWVNREGDSPLTGDICDADRNGQLDRNELRLLWSSLAPPLCVGRGWGTRGDATDLWEWLDAEPNYFLCRGEVETARLKLERLDHNGDELVSLAECHKPKLRQELDCRVGCRVGDPSYERECHVSDAARSVYTVPPCAFDTYDSSRYVAYGSRFPVLLANKAKFPELQERLWRTLEPTEPRPTRLDRDWAADPAHPELRLVYRSGIPVPTLEVRHITAELKPFLAKSSVTSPADLHGPLLTLNLPGVSLEFAGTIQKRETVENVRYDFQRHDTDQNGYLESFEAAKWWPFQAIDHDGDGRVKLDELQTFRTRMALPAQSQVWLTSAATSVPAFQRLDTNGDGHLSPREMRAAAKLLAALDVDANGRITHDEIPNVVRVTLGRGPCGEMAYLPPSPATRSDWFAGMDRNGDGDLSRREFLGTAEKFAALDADKDGLVSRGEAFGAR